MIRLNTRASIFAREEKFFTQTGYLGAEEHKKEHENFLAWITEVQARCKTGSAPLTLDVMVFLNDWLFDHILHADKAYRSHLNDMGIY